MRETRGGSKKSPRVFVHLFARLKNEDIFSSKITVVRNKRLIFALDKTQPFPFPVALRRTHSVKFCGRLSDGTAQAIFDLIKHDNSYFQNRISARNLRISMSALLCEAPVALTPTKDPSLRAVGARGGQ